MLEKEEVERNSSKRIQRNSHREHRENRPKKTQTEVNTLERTHRPRHRIVVLRYIAARRLIREFIKTNSLSLDSRERVSKVNVRLRKQNHTPSSGLARSRTVQWVR